MSRIERSPDKALTLAPALPSADDLKKAVALEAVAEVRSGMVLGLGTGSTAKHAVARIGELFGAGTLTELRCVPTSRTTSEQAVGLGLPMAKLEQVRSIDLAIDGADEVDPRFNLIKGLGGALLEEKRVELKAARLIIVVDESKLVEKLGTKAPLPVEVPQDQWREQAAWLATLGCTPALRGGAQPFITDRGNVILDCKFPGGIDDPEALARALDARQGVLAHGLFLGMASEVLVAGATGVRRLEKTGAKDPSSSGEAAQGRNPGLAARAPDGTARASVPPGPYSIKTPG